MLQSKPAVAPAGTRPWMPVSRREPGPQSGRGAGTSGGSWAWAARAGGRSTAAAPGAESWPNGASRPVRGTWAAAGAAPSAEADQQGDEDRGTHCSGTLPHANGACAGH